MQVLVGDIGGTKTLLALAEVDAGGVRLGDPRRFSSTAHADFLEPLQAFLADTGGSPRAACLAIAGPVETTAGRQVARLTNLPWVMDSAELARQADIPSLTLVNDFEAMGHSVFALAADDLVTLQAGDPREDAMGAVLGAGTGLGQALILPDAGDGRVLATEGGHGDFAAQGSEQVGLYNWLARRFGHVSWERVLSGAGLVNIYRFLLEQRGLAPASRVQAALDDGHDPAPEISAMALDRSDPVCDAALDLFVKVYGAQAGNLALTALARRGVYLAGGIAAKILPRMQDGVFRAAFNDKGRMRELAETMPVHVIVHPRAGLVGAARLAAMHVQAAHA